MKGKVPTGADAAGTPLCALRSTLSVLQAPAAIRHRPWQHQNHAAGYSSRFEKHSYQQGHFRHAGGQQRRPQIAPRGLAA